MSFRRFFSSPVSKTSRAMIFGLCASVSLAGAALAEEVTGFETELMQAAPELFGFLKGNFSAEFQDLVTKAEATHTAGGDVGVVVQGHLLELRKAYAEHIAVASDEALAALGEATISLTSAVLEGEGAATCANYNVNGPVAFEGTAAAAIYEDMLLAQLVYALLAARNGLDTPTQREDASDKDWEAVINHMLASGTTSEEIAGIAKQDPTDPALCGTMIDMFNAMNSEPTGAGSRVRAQFFSQVAAL